MRQACPGYGTHGRVMEPVWFLNWALGNMNFSADEIKIARRHVSFRNWRRQYGLLLVALGAVCIPIYLWIVRTGEGASEALTEAASSGGETAKLAVEAAFLIGHKTASASNLFLMLLGLLIAVGIVSMFSRRRYPVIE